MKQYPVKTTTFICASNIKLDKNALNARHRQAAFSDARKHEVVYNLLCSHDFNYDKIREIGGDLAETRARQLVELARDDAASFQVGCVRGRRQGYAHHWSGIHPHGARLGGC